MCWFPLQHSSDVTLTLFCVVIRGFKLGMRSMLARKHRHSKVWMDGSFDDSGEDIYMIAMKKRGDGDSGISDGAGYADLQSSELRAYYLNGGGIESSSGAPLHQTFVHLRGRLARVVAYE